MSTMLFVAADLVAVTVLAALYFVRHHRRDLVVAFIGINVGVLAVTLVLSQNAVGAGLGLGLFGVLSIIRLRSDEIAQHEVAYYFGALALGLLAGFGNADWLAAALMGLVIAAIYVADHPRLARAVRHQVIVLDQAIVDEDRLREHLSGLLGARIVALSVQRLDLVNDATTVDVRYRLESGRSSVRTASSAAPSIEQIGVAR